MFRIYTQPFAAHSRIAESRPIMTNPRFTDIAYKYHFLIGTKSIVRSDRQWLSTKIWLQVLTKRHRPIGRDYPSQVVSLRAIKVQDLINFYRRPNAVYEIQTVERAGPF